MIAFVLVEQVEGLLPISFAFAAGAMLSLVAIDVVPDALATGSHRRACAGAVVGSAIMVACALLFEVS